MPGFAPMEDLFLVAGLGNPGPDYARTRHNAGFLAVERIGERARVDWKEERKFRARVARGELGGQRMVLCEPLTFMNLSGESIAPLASYYRIAAERVLVLVDDADLPFGQIRLRGSGSSGGHHGLESIESHLGTREFPRLRIGIGRTDRNLREITGHVLGKFGREEEDLLKKVLDRVSSQVEKFLTEGIQKAMSQFNGAVEAPAKKD